MISGISQSSERSTAYTYNRKEAVANRKSASVTEKNVQEEVKPPKLESQSSLKLSPEALKVVEELRKRDQEVRSHEAAHLATAGAYAKGGASFDYQQGPDGKSYAVGGHVSVDTSTESTPQQTLQKMQVIRAAALSPANPSGQDIAVAASASQMMADAQKQIVDLAREQAQYSNEKNSERVNNQLTSSFEAMAGDGSENELAAPYRVNRMHNAYQNSLVKSSSS